MILYLIAQICLILFNVGNALIDSRRIMLGLRIYHGVNFGIYCLATTLLCWITHWDIGLITLFLVSAFCNRQLSFDIPLNRMRDLPWDYVSLAKPPKSITDSIEIAVFGYNGRAPVIVYVAVWLACLIIQFFL